MIKHVSLDFYNTIALPNPAYGAARDEYLAEFCGVDTSAIRNNYKWCKDKFDYEAENYELARTAFNCVSEFLHEMSRTCGGEFNKINACEIVEGLGELYLQFPPIIPEETVEALKKISLKGISLSIISNTNFVSSTYVRRALRKTYPAAEMLFSRMAFSDEYLMVKPNPLFFLQAYEGVLNKTQSLHIGDNSKTDGGAAIVAMQVKIIKNANELPKALNEIK